MKCVEAREEIPGFVRDGDAPRALERHLKGCAECRAEVARYEALLDALGRLQHEVAEPPPGLLHALVSIPRETNLAQSLWWRAGGVRRHVARNRGTYLGSAAVAGAVGALLLRRRMATA